MQPPGLTPVWTRPRTPRIVPVVRKSSFPWVLLIILVVAYAGGHLTGLLLAALGLFIAYFASLRLHPRIRHTGFRSCNGSGERHGAVFTWTFHRCPRCNGGRLIRRGAAAWGAQHIRHEHASTKSARKTAKKNHAWR
jgi:hypothetical protein